MVTRNRMKVWEKQAATIWQQMLGNELASTEGDPLNVIYPGRINGDSGPDFRDAVIVNKLRLTKGDVEVHVRSSDWYNHKHHTDAAYNNVILHVAMWHDCSSATLLQSGKPIPLLCLAKALGHQAYLLPRQLPCFQILDRRDKRTLWSILNTAGEERFRQKAIQFQAEMGQQEAGQVLFRGMMRALGYAKNTKPFEYLADMMPLNFLESRERLALKQALLLGTAGLLPSQRGREELIKEEQVQELEQIWQSAGKENRSMKRTDWNLSHIYPNNSPVRRIIAQSYLLQRYRDTRLVDGILQLVNDRPLSGGQHVLQHGLTVAGDGYWQDHFDFGVRAKTKLSALLGNNKAGEIAINAILPFAFSWGESAGDAKVTDNAMDLYRSYPRLAENCITRHMLTQLCLKESSDFTACQQQGLIHIFRNYCRDAGCSRCPLVAYTSARDSDKILETSYH
jgi:hypothetical protein